MKRINLETYQVGGIPIMTLAHENAEHCPLVFFVHGFTSDKRQGLRIGYELAGRDLFFVGLDAAMHGERFDERLTTAWEPGEDKVYPPKSGLDAFFLMHEIVVQTGLDIDALLDHFDGDGRTDTGRVGVTGFSMGGFATFYIAATSPRVRVAVPMGGIPAFAARWEDVVLETLSYRQWAMAMEQARAETAQRTAFMRRIDPFDRMAAFCPRPLMMIHGDRDLDSPKKYSVDLYRTLKPLYSEHPNRLRLNIHDEAGHELTPAMIQDAADWFCEHL